MAINPLMKSAYPALLAANNMVVSKRLPQRRPLDAMSRLYLPVGIHELPELLDHNLEKDDQGRQIYRLSAAAGLKTLERESAYDLRPGLASNLISPPEKAKLKDRHAQVVQSSPREREGIICRYCALFDALFLDGEPPKIIVVNHDAGIDVDFNVESNISKASITNYQLLLPKQYALKAINGTHPLRWDHSAKEFFEETTLAVPEGSRPHRSWKCHSEGRSDPDQTQHWQQQAAAAIDEDGDGGHLYERAVWPWNTRLTTRVENVLKIRNFANIKVPTEEMNRELGGVKDQVAAKKAFRRSKRAESQIRVEDPCEGLDDKEARILHYEYSLESCIRSNYGIGWEDYNGLNVDDGEVSNTAVHWTQLRPHHVANLKPEALEHLYLSLLRTAECVGGGPDLVKEVEARATVARAGGLGDAAATVCQHLQWIAARLEELWGDEFWFLDVSANKALRFSLPFNGPVETWSALTWMAPAILFTFLNGAVCQLPYTLLKDDWLQQARLAKLAAQ
jgi:hypothetical protein